MVSVASRLVCVCPRGGSRAAASDVVACRVCGDRCRRGAGALVCVFAIAQHLLAWYHPRLQSYFIRQLGVIPVYFLCALGGQLFPYDQPTFVLVRAW